MIQIQVNMKLEKELKIIIYIRFFIWKLQMKWNIYIRTSNFIVIQLLST